MEPTPSDPVRLRALLEQFGITPPEEPAPEEVARRRAELVAQLDTDHAREEERFPDHLVACGVGERTVAVLAAPGETRALAEVTAWAGTAESTCLLLGGPGSGKTVAAASALRLARIRWREEDLVRWRWCQALGLFTTAAKLVASLHGDGDLLARARRVAVLVVDDLGAEYADQGERWVAELAALIDSRHEAMHRTVITSNLSAQAFKARYGERVASRIRGAGRVVPCGIVDLRSVP